MRSTIWGLNAKTPKYIEQLYEKSFAQKQNTTTGELAK